MKQFKLEKGTKKKVIKNQATLSFFLRKVIKPIKDPYLPLYFKSSKQPKHLLQKAKAKEAKYASQHRLGTISPTTSIELYLKENPKQVKRGRPKKKSG